MGLIACVISDNLAVGIDAEPKNQPLKNSFVDVGFTPLEQDRIRRSNHQQPEEMRQRWTIKESLAKMTGQVGFEAIVGFCTGTLSCLEGNAPTFLSKHNAWIYYLPVSNNHFVTLVASQGGSAPPDVEIFDSARWMV
jgi:phosphopantetheinyl transferase